MARRLVLPRKVALEAEAQARVSDSQNRATVPEVDGTEDPSPPLMKGGAVDVGAPALTAALDNDEEDEDDFFMTNIRLSEAHMKIEEIKLNEAVLDEGAAAIKLQVCLRSP